MSPVQIWAGAGLARPFGKRLERRQGWSGAGPTSVRPAALPGARPLLARGRARHAPPPPRARELRRGFPLYSESYLDSTGIFKEAIVALLATLAKQERPRLSDRVKAGMERARAQGKRISRLAIDEKLRTRIQEARRPRQVASGDSPGS